LLSTHPTSRRYKIALVDNDDTLIDKSAKINLDLLKHLRYQVKPNYLAIITGRTIAEVLRNNLNSSAEDNWRDQLAFDDVYQDRVNLQNLQDENGAGELKINFVSTPYDLAHLESDWQGFYQTKMKPFEKQVKENKDRTTVRGANDFWKSNAQSSIKPDSEEVACDSIPLITDKSIAKYTEIVEAFAKKYTISNELKQQIINSHPPSEVLGSKHLQTLNFLRMLAESSNLTSKNYDEIEIAIYDDRQDCIEGMTAAIKDFEKITGIKVKIFSAQIQYGQGETMFDQTKQVCDRLTKELESHRSFYTTHRSNDSAETSQNLFYRLKNKFGIEKQPSPDFVAGENTRYDFKIKQAENNPISKAIADNNQQDYFAELAKIILQTQKQFNTNKSVDNQLDLANITKLITMAIALKGFTEKNDEDLLRNWRQIEGNPKLTAKDLKRFGAIFQREIGKYALTGNPDATRPEVGMRLKRIDINFLPEIMCQAEIQANTSDVSLSQPDQLSSMKSSYQKKIGVYIMKINNLKTPDQPQSTQKPIDKFCDELLIPSNSPIRSSARPLQPRVLATTTPLRLSDRSEPIVWRTGVC